MDCENEIKIDCECILLGVPKTVGSLKRLIDKYPDDTQFCFRNQLRQELFEVKYPDETFVCFQG